MSVRRLRTCVELVLILLCVASGWVWAAAGDQQENLGIVRAPKEGAHPERLNIKGLRKAIEDLRASYPKKYGQGDEYLRRLGKYEKEFEVIQKETGDKKEADLKKLKEEIGALRREALLANPLLDVKGLLIVKRKAGNYQYYNNYYTMGNDIGFPSNHECNSSLKRRGYDNEIAILAPVGPGGKLTKFYRPKDGSYVGEVDLDWEAERLLFTQADEENWKLWEIKTDGTGLRQVSRAEKDVDCFDGCYMPNGKIVFGSTASYQSVPCWHGYRRVTNLYMMNADGTGMRQVCFDQDHDLHPSMLENGQIIYHRWDYTGINHIFLRQLMVMNPDGSGQRAVYGSDSWFPNSLYFPRCLPGESEKLICILSGYHGVHKMGQLVLVDTSKGWYEADGLIERISGEGEVITPKIRDNLVDDDWPKFLHPYPLSDKYFLVSGWMDLQSNWGIYLADVFDNLVLIHEEPGYALFEPVPIMKRKRPPVICDRVDLKRKDGVVYLHNIYAGGGLEGVPQGTIKSLRVLAYHFGYPGLAGADKIGYGGPWEVMRILGTVPLEDDGSAIFKVPANTPVALQALDEEGKAVQLMRSWFTAMPGEILSCVGCHEGPDEVAEATLVKAARRQPQEITPWYGPARGFDFAREVQPVLDKYCVGCHNGEHVDRPDLRPIEEVKGYRGRLISPLAVSRMNPQMYKDTQGYIKYSPAYEALIAYIRRVGVEDDVSMLVPGEYHADTSELMQMMKKRHKGAHLDKEALDRLVTWIDLNGPCHGTWGEVYPIPDKAHERRMELRRKYGGPEIDPEVIPPIENQKCEFIEPKQTKKKKEDGLSGWSTAVEYKPGNEKEHRAKVIDLGGGISMKLVYIPAGEFVIGEAKKAPDERPRARVVMNKPFWMGMYEVTNGQFRRYDPSHDSRYYTKRHGRDDDKGLTLNEPQQPAVRVSWEQAMKYCEWLSDKTGMKFTLPSEGQWEYACRAGTETMLSYGGLNDDFSPWANMNDKAFTIGQQGGGKQITGGLEHLFMEGADRADRRYNDGGIVTREVGQYKPNAWGLYDMHGNAAEWTVSTYRAYPYSEDDGRNNPRDEGRKVVRGGSFFDRTKRCRSAFRLDYPKWQRVFNVGFRVVSEIDNEAMVTVGDVRTKNTTDQDLTKVRSTKQVRQLALRETRQRIKQINLSSLRLALEDLTKSYPRRYKQGQDYLKQLTENEKRWGKIRDSLKDELEALEKWQDLLGEMEEFRYKVLTGNPLVCEKPILYVVHQQYKSDHHNTATLFQVGEINEKSFAGGGALKTIDFGKGGAIKTLLETEKGIVRDPELDFNGKKIICSIRKDEKDDYHIFEMNVDGTGLKQLTFAQRVSDIDPLYLPDNSIVFSSTREPKFCMCNRHIMANLYRMDADGANIHQIGKNTLFEGHGTLLPDGRILYDRWEYVDRNFGDAQGLWTVNPDGTNHALYWGNNTVSPGGVFDARPIPGTQQVVCVFGSCHDRPWGAMTIVDRRLGLDGAQPVVNTWPKGVLDLMGGADGSKTIPLWYAGKYGFDNFKKVIPKYEDPYPLSDKYFLCSRQTGRGEHMGIYLIDVFGNEILLHAEKESCFEPMPLGPRSRPPVIPSRRNFENQPGYFYVVNVYEGTHMQGVKHGAVKSLRVVESPEKRFFAPQVRWEGMGRESPAMNWHNFTNKRILGTVPVEEDGSAYFSVPADKFVFFQLLDEKGMMIQSMRSGTLVQPGERTGCVGCHESRLQSPSEKQRSMPIALQRAPSELQGWYGASRQFNFSAEVQPVLNKYCMQCHDYGTEGGAKLNLAGDRTLTFNTSYNEMWRKKYITAIGAGPAEIQKAYSWGSHASKLIQMILKGHYEIKLDPESFARLVTWIDINAPYYPYYASAYPHNMAGRCPLTNQQLNRLSELTEIPFKKLADCNRNRGPQVSFDRPELSPCLKVFDNKNDPRYLEALSIIQAGKEQLACRPRADMADFKYCPADQERQRMYSLRQKVELDNRAVLRKGGKIYDSR